MDSDDEGIRSILCCPLPLTSRNQSHVCFDGWELQKPGTLSRVMNKNDFEKTEESMITPDLEKPYPGLLCRLGIANAWNFRDQDHEIKMKRHVRNFKKPNACLLCRLRELLRRLGGMRRACHSCGVNMESHLNSGFDLNSGFELYSLVYLTIRINLAVKLT